MLKLNSEEIAHGIELVIFEFRPFLARAYDRAFESRHRVFDSVMLEAISKDAAVKAAVVRDQKIRADKVAHRGPCIGKARSALDMLIRDAMDTRKRGKDLQSLGRLYQRKIGVVYFSAAHPDKADRAGARAIVACRLEIYRAKVERSP